MKVIPIYSTTNRIKFTDIPEKYSIPRQFKAKQSQLHSSIVTYVYDHYVNTKKFRQKVVDALNILTYHIINNSLPKFSWYPQNPLEDIPETDMEDVQNTLRDFFLVPEAIEWDIPISDVDVDNVIAKQEPNIADSESELDEKQQPVEENEPKKAPKPANPFPVKAATPLTSNTVNKPLSQIKRQQRDNVRNSILPTPKEDLYIQPPRCPRFDVSKVWISANVGNDNLVIYSTIPEIPTKQNEVSMTTNVDAMTESELIALYPNHIIHTRAQQMYDKYDTMDYDEDIGCIIPIEGFTKEQVVDNIIRYPHLYRLRKLSPEGKLLKFFGSIEINGQLIPIKDAWDTLPESKLMPRDPEFVKEYVIRRFLLERDSGMKHTYPMFGSLDPFLTLFMPFTKYIERGYTDTLSIVKQCVISRVRYKQTRSPILRRIEQNV